MIIEFIGCSGAGKTVLREAIASELRRRGQQAYCPLTTIIGPGLSRMRLSPKLTNLLLDIATVPRFVTSQLLNTTDSWADFLNHCRLAVTQNAMNTWEKVRLLRSLYRKLAVHQQLSNRRNPSEVVLVDEGIIQLAQMLHGRNFASTGTNLDIEALNDFSASAPKPDLVVWVKAPLAILEQRIQERNTHRPMPGRTAEVRKEFLRSADALINVVVTRAFSSSEVVSIENCQQNPNDLKHHAQHVADAIRTALLTRLSGNADAPRRHVREA